MDILDLNNKKVDIQKMSIADVSLFFKNNSALIADNLFDYYNNQVINDSRQGVKKSFSKIQKIKDKNEKETKRVKVLYDFENQIAARNKNCIICGLDEVGRGPLAGPLTVGAVVLDKNNYILGLNDSKKIAESKRRTISQKIKESAICWKTYSVPAKDIDDYGITKCLKYAFKSVVNEIEKTGIYIDVILLDGNPLNFDKREVNIIKGDAKCASISAASIIAKVERDNYMIKISQKYPNYDFASNKGYGTAKHIEVIKNTGLSSIHRKSYCKSFMQMSFF